MTTSSQTILNALVAANRHLTPQAREQIATFVLSRSHPAGGCMGRQDKADSYYTTFGLALALAMELPVDIALEKQFLSSRPAPNDLVHTISLLRCFLLLEALKATGRRGAKRLGHAGVLQNLFARHVGRSLRKHPLFEAVQAYRSRDGGYHHEQKNAPAGTAYGAYLVQSLCEDLGAPLKEVPPLSHLACGDGSFGNEPAQATGLVTATAAALIVQRPCPGYKPEAAIQWLMHRESPHGGLTAGPGTDMPDLLSTATGLLALHMAGAKPGPLGQRAAALTDLHWEGGGFFGSIADPVPDIEYTYYALLILGLTTESDQ